MSVDRARRQSLADNLADLARLLPEIDDDAKAWRHRHHSRGVLTDDEIARQVEDWRERKENAIWLERHGLTPPGPSPLPIDLRARDLRAQITTLLVALEYDVAISLGTAYEQADSDLLRIGQLRGLLRRLHVADGLTERVEAQVGVALQLARDALDPPQRGQLGACPWCGARSLEVDYEAATVTCTNRRCVCSRTDCTACNPTAGAGRGRHVWGRDEWEKLAQLCRAADAARTQPEAEV